MPITNLHVTNVGPFDEIHFEFDDHVNVFIGPNNSGKTSALCVLADVAVFPFSFPEKLLRPDKSATFEVYSSGHSEGVLEGQLPIVRAGGPDADELYWIPERWQEYVSFMRSLQFSKFVPALRLSTDFRSKGPTASEQEDSPEDLYLPATDFESLWRNHLALFRVSRIMQHREQEEDLRKRIGLLTSNATLVGDEQVIQTIIEWDYRSYLRNQPELRRVLTDIGAIAEEITDGFIMGFEGVSEQSSGFVPGFQTVDGVLPINALSQGTQSIIQWLCHLIISYAVYYDFPKNLSDLPGIFIVDEIDAHLHPSWQRRIIPTLVTHYPNLQIFCSTHSPLLLAGLKEGQVQLLERDGDNNVTVSRNNVDIVGWTGDEILRNLLGVSDPTDLETVRNLVELERLASLAIRTSEESERLRLLRNRVSHDLLRGPTVAEQLEDFAELLNVLGEDAGPSPSDFGNRQGE